MENLGKYFLDLRIKRDYSYKRVWEDIRIHETTIKKIEDNRFFELGGYGIAKAMIYNYARYLEADVDAVMREFTVMMPEHTKGKFSPRKTVKEKKVLLSTNFLWMIGIVIFVAVLASILWHANNQGWLNAPQFFRSTAADSSLVRRDDPRDEARPDTLRSRMRTLSKAIPATNQATITQNQSNSVPPDTTDYMGNILGDSPVNVPLH